MLRSWLMGARLMGARLMGARLMGFGTMGALALWLAGPGCASAPAWRSQQVGRVRVAFPAPAELSRGHEGDKAVALIASARQGDARLEVAAFALTRSLDPAERAELLAAVERGLLARGDPAGRARRGDTRVAGRPGRWLDIELAEDRRGHWRIVYAAPDHLIQLSVIGPDGPELGALAERFFRSAALP